MKTIATILLISLSFISTSQEVIDLFVWAGQSNALGRQGDASGYPEDVDNLDGSIRFNWTVANGSNSGGWTTMQPQIGYFPSGHFGPEVTFSRNLVQAGYNPAIFKYTQGATSIFEHWQSPGDGGLYDDMITSLNSAISTLEDEGHTVNFRGGVWIQGESDSNSDAAANAYFDNLTAILNDFRNDVANAPNLPTILGVDEQYFNLEDQERPQILNAHQKIALDDNNIKFTSMYGFPKADASHLTPEGLINHGEHIFDTFQMLISGEQPVSSCTLSSEGDVVSILFARSWGQSFKTDCSGYLSAITFSAASELNSSATFTLHNGADCSGEVILTKALNNISVGDNAMYFDDEFYIEKEHTYYINVTADENIEWQINYSNTSNVIGNLKTNRDGESNTSCRRNFYSFDWNFSVDLNTGECIDPENIYAFTYDNKTYEIVKQNKTWAEAAFCAQSNGGMLTEINSQAEQDAIFEELQTNANITISNTIAPDGGNASYIWIGANDIAIEETWVWDGNNDGISTQFWLGGVAGSPTNGLYNNWGNEPDNWNEQNAAAIALTQWPINTGTLGSSGQWNDVDQNNSLYFIIEYPGIVNLSETHSEELLIFPIPVEDILTIQNKGNAMETVQVLNSLGQTIKYISTNDLTKEITISFVSKPRGVYYVNIRYKNGKSITRKIIK